MICTLHKQAVETVLMKEIKSDQDREARNSNLEDPLEIETATSEAVIEHTDCD